MKRITNILLFSLGFLFFMLIFLAAIDLMWDGKIAFEWMELIFLLIGSILLGTLTEFGR